MSWISHFLNPSPNPSPSPSPNPSSSTIIPRLVTIYTPYLRLIQLLRKHWSLIHDDPPSLSLLFHSPPQLSYRTNPTLRDSLVRASLPGSSRPPTGQVPPIPINWLEPRMINSFHATHIQAECVYKHIAPSIKPFI